MARRATLLWHPRTCKGFGGAGKCVFPINIKAPTERGRDARERLWPAAPEQVIFGKAIGLALLGNRSFRRLFATQLSGPFEGSPGGDSDATAAVVEGESPARTPETEPSAGLFRP